MIFSVRHWMCLTLCWWRLLGCKNTRNNDGNTSRTSVSLCSLMQQVYDRMIKCWSTTSPALSWKDVSGPTRPLIETLNIKFGSWETHLYNQEESCWTSGRCLWSLLKMATLKRIDQKCEVTTKISCRLWGICAVCCFMSVTVFLFYFEFILFT